ncbi:protein of unknown function [Cyanobium sp. NIES-981]|nr:protein of unknown function [Cyanobium sp. NIES-981]
MNRPTAAALPALPSIREIIDDATLKQAKPSYRALLNDALIAIRREDLDTEMELRAEIIGRFRRNDGQINAELLQLLTAQESGADRPTYGAVEIADAEPMRWLLDGFIPANDQVLLYGEAGAGKTTAAIALAFAVIDGTGLLDRSTPASPGKVLFISSDSGQAPLMEVLERSDYGSHPALRDSRFTVWGHSKVQSRKPWDASIAGCLALLKAVQDQGIELVLIDSCKVVTTKADLEYTSNSQVTALLTFFQEVICQYCSVIWLNHDGTGKGMHAGAKAWREVPSSVQSIEKVEQHDGECSGNQLRQWSVRKCRMGAERRFQYELGQDTGRVQLTADGGTPVVGDCSTLIWRLLRNALEGGASSLTRQELIEACFRSGYSAKTADNTLGNLCRSRLVVRPTRGRYCLAPKVIQGISLKGVSL